MAKQVQEAYIVAATRTPVAKRNGAFRHVRPDDLLAHVLKSALAQVPTLDPAMIADVVVGCAMPEAEQGINVARMGALLAGLPVSVPGVTVNRLCASGLQAIADAANRIRLGEADVMLAAGVESMTVMSNMMGNKVMMNPAVFSQAEHIAIAYGMGLTAEKVASQWQISRQAQDDFAVESHRRATAAIAAGHFNAEISPYAVVESLPDLAHQQLQTHQHMVLHDEGARTDVTTERLAKLKPVFHAQGSVTAGNASQMSDGAGALVLVSEKVLKMHNLTPLARFVSYAVSGVAPEIMGIGPIAAIPAALKMANIALSDLAWTELNEAFAAQALAVLQEIPLNPAQVNPLGGAIALGHPLGATGAIRAATLLHGLQRTGGRYGMVSMCVGVGMGAAGVFERL